METPPNEPTGVTPSTNAGAGAESLRSPNRPERIDPPPVPEPVLPDEGPTTLSSWLARNIGSIVLLAAVLGVVFYRYDPYSIFKVAIGLGLVVFIHELGHFLAAKWCDVHVETFSIGFGPAIPGCSYTYGETTYMIGLIPLGGYVKMIGEGENADTDEAEEDPRSFKNKTVYQRMMIISAGVIMNILLACICFVIVYLHGLKEVTSTIGQVAVASPAWNKGVRSEMAITQIGNRPKPFFADIRPIVMNTDKGEKLLLKTTRDGKAEEFQLEPWIDRESLVPMIGVGPVSRLVLASSNRKEFLPFTPGSPAERAYPVGTAAKQFTLTQGHAGGQEIDSITLFDTTVRLPWGGDGFRMGDKIVAMSTIADPTKVTELTDYFDFHRRLVDLAGKEILVDVQRRDSAAAPIRLTVPPAFMRSFGLRMKMGAMAGVRENSPAARAIPKDPPSAVPGIQIPNPEYSRDKPRLLPLVRKTDLGFNILTAEFIKPAGDELIELEVMKADGRGRIRFMTIPRKDAEEGVEIRRLDPERLPSDLDAWARSLPSDIPANDPRWKVRLTVLRELGHVKDHRVVLETEWDNSWRYSRETSSALNSPLSIPGLGFAYRISTQIDEVIPGSPADRAGLKPGDVIREIIALDYVNGELKERESFKPAKDQYAFMTQLRGWYRIFDLSVERRVEGKEQPETLRVRLTAEEDPTWPIVERGLYLEAETSLQKAETIGEALDMGLWRTGRSILLIYQNLRAMIFGQVSLLSLRGPISIASRSYDIAYHEDLFTLILFIGMINVNLAVVNFLPIPVLDGGHMMFLLYEKLRGKPAPESFFYYAMLVGLALIMSLMLFVISLDIARLFGWM